MIIIFLIPQVVKIPGVKNKYHWWLEVRVFVGGTERIQNEDRVEALNNNRKSLKQKRGLARIS